MWVRRISTDPRTEARSMGGRRPPIVEFPLGIGASGAEVSGSAILLSTACGQPVASPRGFVFISYVWGSVALVSTNVDSFLREAVQARMHTHEQGVAGVATIVTHGGEEPTSMPLPCGIGAESEEGDIAHRADVAALDPAGWRDAIAFTRGKSPASFDQWFSGVQFDGLTDGVLSLRARDEFVRQWVEDYFLPTLGESLRSQTALSIQVRWSIGGALDRPVADRPSSFAPVKPRPLSVRPAASDGAACGMAGGGG